MANPCPAILLCKSKPMVDCLEEGQKIVEYAGRGFAEDGQEILQKIL
jgi:hypothetical protein